MSTVTQSISLVAVSMTVNTNQPSSHFSYYLQHTQTHYSTSARYIIIISHASNIWSGADVKKFFTLYYILLKTMATLVLDLGHTNITQQQMQYILS